MICTGVAVAGWSASDLARHPVGLPWLALAALTVGSGWATLRVPEMPISFSISDIFSIAAAVLFGPAAGAITAALDGLVLSFRMTSSRRSVERVLFNMAALTIAIWIAAQAFGALGGYRFVFEGPLSVFRLLALLALFGALDYALNSGIVAVAVGFERHVPMLSIWRTHMSGVWVSPFAGIFAASWLILFGRTDMIHILVVLVPLPVILYVTFRHAIGRTGDQLDHLATVNRVYLGAIEALAHAVDAKDEVTHDHTRRVQERAVRLARVLGVDDEGELQAIKAGALLHDVGKLAVPEHILNKPGPLTPAEYEIMKRHAPIGADILSVIGLPFAVAPIVRSHHESWDGTGYPDGVAGERIPVGSRILAVVDCFDALTSDRPYRPRMEDHAALQILADRRGTMYDPRVVDAFMALHRQGTVAVPESAPAVPVAPAPSGAPIPADEKQRDLDLHAFFDLGRGMTAAASLVDVGAAVWTHLSARLPAAAFVLFGCDEERDSLVAVYRAGEGVEGVGAAPIARGERLSGWVAATGRTIVNSDARLDIDAAMRAESDLRSTLAVPVGAADRVIAVLTFYANRPGAFDDSHQRLVEAAAGLLGEEVPMAGFSALPGRP